MADKNASDPKLKKGARLLSKTKGTSLRPDSGHKNTGGENKKTSFKKDRKESALEKVKNQEKKKDHHAAKTAHTSEKHSKQTDAKKAFEKLQEKRKEISKKSDDDTPRKKDPIVSHTHIDERSRTRTSYVSHIIAGLLIAGLLLSLAYLWPQLPFNANKVAIIEGEGQEVVGGTVGDVIFGEGEDATPPGAEVDGDGFVIIDEPEDLNPIVDDLILESEPEVPVIISTPAEEEVIKEAPVVEVTPDPITYTTPRKTVGDWSFLYLNTEKFDLDDEDDDVDEIYLKDVCKSIFKQNSNVVDFCRKSSKLKKSTASGLGEEKCDGGGSCRVGNTCLIWNDKEEDNGDLKSYTAMYICE